MQTTQARVRSRSFRSRVLATTIGALLTTLAAQAAAPRATLLDKPTVRVVAAGGTASAVDVAYLQGRKPTAPDAITALGPDLFGDKLNLYNGSFSFEPSTGRAPSWSFPVKAARKSWPTVAFPRRADAGR